MKKIATIIAIVLFGTMTFAQNIGSQGSESHGPKGQDAKAGQTEKTKGQPNRTVKGVVLDSLTREGEPAAILQFFSVNDPEKPVAFTTTDEEGNFSHTFNVKGDYYMLFDNMGRKKIRKDFRINGEEIVDLGTILAQDNAETLKAGSIVAQRPLVKMEVDKMTYNVEDDVDSKSATVLDMLRKVPMVTVDGQDNITVNGSSSFTVLVDGKPNAMLSSNPSQVFKSMPASAVKDIQVITNPGVKYDAEGVGGVLNLITARDASGKKTGSLDGYNATVRAMATTRGGGGGLFLTGQKGKFSYSTNLNGMYNRIAGTESETTRDQLDASGNVLSTMQNSAESVLKVPMLMANLSAGYEIDSLRLVSVSFGAMSMRSKAFSDGTTTLGPISYGSDTESLWDATSINGGIDYQKISAKNPERVFTLSYQLSSSPTDTDTKSLFKDTEYSFLDLTDRKTDGLTNTLENTLQADFTTPVGIGQTVDFGAKFINRRNTSDQKFYLMDGSSWVYNDTGSLNYVHNNNIVAGYAEYALNKASWGAKAGLRYEHTFVDVDYSKGSGNNFSLDYGNLIPTASFQYNISQTQNLGLSYNMRISRPGITYLNPYVDVSDPTARSYGNSDLKAEKAHHINLVYNFFSPKFMLNLTLRETIGDGGINSYSFYDENNLLNTTYGNIVSTKTTGLNGFMNWSITNKTRLMMNASVGYTDLRSDILGLANSGWHANIFAGGQTVLPKDFRLSANIMYATKNYSLEGWSTGMTMLMGGVTKSFLDDRLSVGINGVAGLGKHGDLRRESYSAGSDYRMSSVSTVPMAQMMVNLSWSFGKNNRSASVKRSRKSISNDDVMDRSNAAEEMNSMTTTTTAM